MSENADGDADPYHSQKINRVDGKKDMAALFLKGAAVSFCISL